MKYLSLVISLSLTAFVFSFSTTSGDQSASLSLELSMQLKNFLENIIPAWEIHLDSLHIVIRKAAHILEFFILGLSWYISFKLFKVRLSYLIFLGLLLPLIDEGIQVFSIDRGPSIIDALLFDFPGFIVGSTILPAIYKKIFQQNAPN